MLRGPVGRGSPSSEARMRPAEAASASHLLTGVLSPQSPLGPGAQAPAAWVCSRVLSPMMSRHRPSCCTPTGVAQGMSPAKPPRVRALTGHGLRTSLP